MSLEPDVPLVPAPLLATPAPTNVLVGPLGLRAGWGILLFFILSGLLGTALFLGVAKGTHTLQPMQTQGKQSAEDAKEAKAAHRDPHPQPIRLSFGFVSEPAQTAAVLLAALGLSFLERRRFGTYGLPQGRLRAILPGALAGFVAMALLIGTLRALHLLVFDGQLLHGTTALRYGLGWMLLFFLVGLFEEFLFRGYIQFTLTRGLLGLARRLAPAHERLIAFWLSALVWSALFLAAHLHNAGENPTGLISVFLAGIAFSYALWRTGSLWWGVGAHMTWDWAQSFLFGVPDSGTLSAGLLFATHAAGNRLLSGGVDGPEGSLLVIPAFLLLLLAIRLHPQAPQPVVEPDSLPFTHDPLPEPVA